MTLQIVDFGTACIDNNWLNYIFVTPSQEEAPPVREEAFTCSHKLITVGWHAHVSVSIPHVLRLTADQLIKGFLSGSYCMRGVRQVHLRITPEQSFINYSVACNGMCS